MAKNRNSAARAGNYAKSASISATLDKPNPWSDWLRDKEIGPLAWSRLTALLLRRLPPARLAEALAPVLDRVRRALEEQVVSNKADEVDTDPVRADFAGYHHCFLENLGKPVAEVLRALTGDDDIRWFARHVATKDPWIPSLLWFFMGGIANACLDRKLEPSQLSEPNRWLAQVAWPEPADESAFDHLVTIFYDDFASRHSERAEVRTESCRDLLDNADPFEDGSLYDYWARVSLEASKSERVDPATPDSSS